MKILIIEDERLTALDLSNTIKAIEPDAEILPFIYSVEDGLQFFKQDHSVDLIFSDIELSDGSSFDIFQKNQVKAPIVFCTAFQQYMIDAFSTLGIDYILKPFSKISVERALRKYNSLKINFEKLEDDRERLFKMVKANIFNNDHSVIIHQGDKIIPLKVNDIALFYIENESVFAFTFDRKKYLTSQKLDVLEVSFENYFFRANRQFLVHRKAIKDATHSFNRKIVVNLIVPFPEQIIVGKLKTTDFVKWLSGS